MMEVLAVILLAFVAILSEAQNLARFPVTAGTGRGVPGPSAALLANPPCHKTPMQTHNKTRSLKDT
jgi:hypothetical protein